jgi:quercetin dioxygenase-like cupin family protein
VEEVLSLLNIRRILVLALVFLWSGWFQANAQAPDPQQQQQSMQNGAAALLVNLSEVKWEKIMPDLGEDSPDISILHVDPKTRATQLLIRLPKNFHVPKHWHTSNETHTILSGSCIFACGETKGELSAGGFNYMPAKMVHEAWTTEAGAVAFITVDGAWDVNWVGGVPTAQQVKEPAPR